MTQLILAPLSQPISAELRALADSAAALRIPQADEEAFLTDFYPFLRRQGVVTSRDGSFDLPGIPRPVLALSITHSAGTSAGQHIDLRWEWRYLAEGEAPVATAGVRRTLWQRPGDTKFRDEARETGILLSLETRLAPFPTVAPEYRGVPRLNTTATLAGAAMIAFLDAVPGFAGPDVVVHVTGHAPDYRAAEAPPVISVATADRADSHDWFDLDVTVSIDGEDIPFDALFRALAVGQELMILPSGTYFASTGPSCTSSAG